MLASLFSISTLFTRLYVEVEQWPQLTDLAVEEAGFSLRPSRREGGTCVLDAYDFLGRSQDKRAALNQGKSPNCVQTN